MSRTEHATGTFTIELVPGQAELDGHVARMDFAKQFQGDLSATGKGLMLSAGDPDAGTAGYVAIERVVGELHGLSGGFALQQYGTMSRGGQTMQYAIVPGSGSGSLASISGQLELTIEPDGTHRFALDYEL